MSIAPGAASLAALLRAGDALFGYVLAVDYVKDGQIVESSYGGDCMGYGEIHCMFGLLATNNQTKIDDSVFP